ncbi:APC family permease [Paractinoplanes globisporus]|uniref:APC family permease n=1 Tax=Paractinoplanes globisporus TaxID=113565 RepID=A0ABW6WBW6_9ACTN|nr:amino acid permease [Actinoplanes globisporus]
MTELSRRLDTRDAVVVGLGAMLGAGVFASFAPAARAAGGWLPVALALAAVVAYCNATSSARLAAIYPQSGGTYVYGRERLGPFWGYLAGWTFVVGKTASCAAMALTFAAYAAPGYERPAGVAAVLALTALNYFGVQRSVQASRVIVAIVLIVLAAVVVTAATGPHAPNLGLGGEVHPLGILQAAGLLFFAFAGYARIATLGEEVRDPARTIPRAIAIALAIVLVVYALVAFAVLAALGPAGLAGTTAPLAEAAPAWLDPAVRAGAAVAALGALLALILGVSRTGFAMARDGFFPRALTAVHPRHGVPHRAELAVGLLVAVLVATVDLRGAIGFSSFGVLLYYAVANASAFTLPDRSKVVPVAGLAGCLLLAATLPWHSSLAGLVVVLAGVAWYMYSVRR